MQLIYNMWRIWLFKRWQTFLFTTGQRCICQIPSVQVYESRRSSPQPQPASSSICDEKVAGEIIKWLGGKPLRPLVEYLLWTLLKKCYHQIWRWWEMKKRRRRQFEDGTSHSLFRPPHTFKPEKGWLNNHPAQQVGFANEKWASVRERFIHTLCLTGLSFQGHKSTGVFTDSSVETGQKRKEKGKMYKDRLQQCHLWISWPPPPSWAETGTLLLLVTAGLSEFDNRLAVSCSLDWMQNKFRKGLATHPIKHSWELTLIQTVTFHEGSWRYFGGSFLLLFAWFLFWGGVFLLNKLHISCL